MHEIGDFILIKEGDICTLGITFARSFDMSESVVKQLGIPENEFYEIQLKNTLNKLISDMMITLDRAKNEELPIYATNDESGNVG